MWSRILKLLVLLSVLRPSLGIANALRLEAKEEGRWIGSALDFKVSAEKDPRSVLELKDWIRSDSKVPNFGYTSKPYWAKADLLNPAAEPRTYYFVFYGPFERIRLYQKNSLTGDFVESVQGMFERTESTKTLFRFPVFKLSLPPGESTLLFKEEVVAPHYPVRVFTEDEFEQFRYREHLFIMFIYGIALILLALSIIVAIFFPKASHSYFLFSYVFCILCSLFVTGGGRPIFAELSNLLAIDLFPLEQIIYRNWLFCAGAFEFLSLCFAWRFLGLKSSGSRRAKIVQSIGLIASSGLGTLSYINPVFAINAFALVYNVIAVYYAWTAFKMYRGGFRPAKNYAIAWALYGLFMTYQHIYFFGFIGPSFLTSWAILLASLAQFFFFGLSVFDKSDFIESKLREQNEEALHSLEVANQNLESANKNLEMNFARMKQQSEALRVFVSPTVQAEVLAGLNPLDHPPEEVSRIVVFADMRNYTSFAESNDLIETYKTLNNCFAKLMEPVFENQGEVDKTQGDAVMSIFHENQVQQCLQSVIESRKRLSLQNRERVAKGLIPIKYGQGIALGTVMSGNFGCALKLDRTVVGDAANVASRIESETKNYKVDILASFDFVRELKDYPYVRAIDSITLKGKSHLTPIYEIFGHNSEEVINFKMASKPTLELALKAKLDGDYQRAIGLLEELIRNCPKHTYKADTIMDETLEAILARLTAEQSKGQRDGK